MISSVLAARRQIGGPLAVGGGGASDWFRAGGAPMPWAAYQAKGAASLVASYLDLSGNGNDATPVVAPTWNATDGQIYNGVDQYLDTGFVPSTDQTQVMLLQFTNGPAAFGPYLCGSNGNSASRTYFALQVATSGNCRAGNGEIAVITTTFTSGNFGVGGNRGYVNGVATGGTLSTWLAPGTAVYIGCRNNNGVAAGFAAYRLQAFVIYDDSTNHAVWVPAVAAAMAAL